jgi:hypothetical protein
MKIVVLLLGLAAVAFAVKYELDGKSGARAAHTAPREQLDNVRDKAHDLEKELQKAADEAGRNTESR